MFILDKPFVSDFLKQTVLKTGLPVLDNAMARTVLRDTSAQLVCKSDFLRNLREGITDRIYCNSEDAFGWVAKNMAFTELPEKIQIFKDKALFRQLLKGLYPDCVCQDVPREQLHGIDISGIPKPFILKPAVGFFSLGVHKIDSDENWYKAVEAVEQQVTEVQDLYPREVLDLDRFVIESYIEGEEFAIDAYYTADGNPVILNVLKHLFASEADVSDRVYVTSGSIIESWHEPFTQFLRELGRLADLKSFPVHVEVRVDKAGRIVPIEVNPMRFAGWCVTDLAYHAYRINPYEYYLDDKEPDWANILKTRTQKTWAVVIADIESDIDRTRITSVDYDGFVARFSKPLELRKVDYVQHPLWAFLFTESDGDGLEELEPVLHMDLNQFLTRTSRNH